MNVDLISITNSMIDKDAYEVSAEELIVYIARVSNPSNQMNFETSDRLIAYLVKNKHWSPFEMVDMTVEITTSRAMAQQILRHRSFSFQEFSQRYAKVTDMEDIQLRYQADKNRQSSSEELSGDDAEYFKRRIKQSIDLAKEVYNEMLERGVAKECARFVLPLTTQTRLYMKGSIRSWIHYLQVRNNSHTQLEHRQIALSILDIFREKFPNITKGLDL